MKRALLLALLVASAACSGSDGPTDPSGGTQTPPTTNTPPTTTPPTTSGPQVHTITLEAASFSPANLTIKAGDTVVWTNSTAITHTVTPQGHTMWESANTSAQGEVMRMTFNTPGTYNYFCQPHSGSMRGVIVVQ